MTDTPRIVIHNQHTELFANQLLENYPNADFRECRTYDELSTLLESYRPEIVYSVRFAGTPNFPQEPLFSSVGLKWVANGGAGTDHFGNWDPSKITVTNAAGVAADMMAEYVIAGFLYFTIGIPGLMEDKANRRWAERKVIPVKDKTLLIIGLGHTGRALAARAKAFGMRVIGTRAHAQPMDNVDEVLQASELMNSLPNADFIAVCTPLTSKTRGMLSTKEFSAIKTGAILADVSRGGVVDQSAILEALETNKLGGAVLDVFETEPLSAQSPLWDVQNVILSPHCSSVYEGWELASFNLFLENLENWIHGRPLMNVVNPSRGY